MKIGNDRVLKNVMIGAILILITVFVVSCSGGSDGIEQESLNEYGQQYWDVDSSIQWEDFQYPPTGNETRDAASFIGLTWNIDFTGSENFVTIHAYFRPDSSLVVEGEETPELLKHEQMHFNLAEIAARNTRKEISNWPGPGDFNSFAQACIDSIRCDLRKTHNRYDSITEHGANQSEQMKWNRIIDSTLRSLDDYAEPTARVEMTRGYYKR